MFVIQLLSFHVKMRALLLMVMGNGLFRAISQPGHKNIMQNLTDHVKELGQRSENSVAGCLGINVSMIYG